MRTSFACDLETMERLVSFEREYSERYSLPTDSARKAAIHREYENRRTAKRIVEHGRDMIDLSIKINDEAMRGHLDRDLANTAVAALIALGRSINK